MMIVRVLSLVLLTISAPALADEPVAPQCEDPDSHDETNPSPHLQGTDDPNEDDVCHGKSGESGSCTVGGGSGQDTASVSCANQPPFVYCIATANCGPGQNSACGDQGWDAFAGIDHTNGKAYVHCTKGSQVVDFKCP